MARIASLPASVSAWKASVNQYKQFSISMIDAVCTYFLLSAHAIPIPPALLHTGSLDAVYLSYVSRLALIGHLGISGSDPGVSRGDRRLGSSITQLPLLVLGKLSNLDLTTACPNNYTANEIPCK